MKPVPGQNITPSTDLTNPNATDIALSPDNDVVQLVLGTRRYESGHRVSRRRSLPSAGTADFPQSWSSFTRAVQTVGARPPFARARKIAYQPRLRRGWVMRPKLLADNFPLRSATQSQLMGSLIRPSLLLLFRHSDADYLIHRRLGNGAADRQAFAVASSIVDQVLCVGSQVRVRLTQIPAHRRQFPGWSGAQSPRRPLESP
jgi:hypothetical protein